LQGFEQRARRLRRWEDGNLPEQLSEHTSLAHPRRPALLHLALEELQGRQRHLELLFTDLPGEWTRSLVERADTAARFAFVGRADGLILVADANALAAKTTRSGELLRHSLLLERLAETLRLPTSLPLLLAVAKSDGVAGELPEYAHRLAEHARSLGLSCEIVQCAAFSSCPQRIANGLGVVGLVRRIGEGLQPLPDAKSDVRGLRSFQRFEK
jgi:hypothetical protein